MRFEIVICESVADLPDWCSRSGVEVAVTAEAEGEIPIVVARRFDGETQTIPQREHDPEVMVALLRWAAGVDA